MINYTKPYLPPYKEYEEYLQKIWQSQWLTNNGPLVNELELKLKELLGVPHLLYLTNGTVALQIAIKALELNGEIITTPFSYVATTSSIVWENCKPVFVDLNVDTLNIDADKIESAVTKKTTGILVTHVYGNPCDVEKIQQIAEKHNLKVIYDAAHCFGVEYKGQSILSYGNVSTMSFHATKIFHTVEGGAVVTNDSGLLRKMAYMRKFGHDGPFKYAELGINGKNSEFHAAMGLCNMKYVAEILRKRKEQYIYYQHKLKNLDVRFQTIHEDTNYNYSYLPIIFKSEESLLASEKALAAHRVFPRRYFHPALTELFYVEDADVPIAKDVSKRVLCLPLFHHLNNETIDMICRVLIRVQNYENV